MITFLRNAGRLGISAAVAIALIALLIFRLSGSSTPLAKQSGATGTGSSPAPAPSLTAVGPQPADCALVSVNRDRVTPAQELALGRNVVTATVVDVEASARWATPTGAMPTVEYFSDAAAALYTIAHVRVTGVGRGSVAVGRTLTIRVQGGTTDGLPGGVVGRCATVQFTGDGSITPGASVALFLGSLPALAQAAVPADFDVTDSWAIDNQIVEAPDGTSLSVAAFLAEAQGN